MVPTVIQRAVLEWQAAATQAVRIRSQHIDGERATAALTGAILSDHNVIGAPRLVVEASVPFTRSIDTEHSFKYARACLSEYRWSNDHRYTEEIRKLRDSAQLPD